MGNQRFRHIGGGDQTGRGPRAEIAEFMAVRTMRNKINARARALGTLDGGMVNAFLRPEGEKITAKGIIAHKGEIGCFGALAGGCNGRIGGIATMAGQIKRFALACDGGKFHQGLAKTHKINLLVHAFIPVLPRAMSSKNL